MRRSISPRFSAACWRSAVTYDGAAPRSTPTSDSARVRPVPHVSRSLAKRLWARDVWRSRKPSTSELARPKSDVEKAVPMPESGASSPLRNVSNICADPS
jgi:hypothetical protein